MAARPVVAMLLLAGLAACARPTDWTSLARAPVVRADSREPGVLPVPRVDPRPVAVAPRDGFAMCEAAVLMAQAREQTPPGLLGAIAQVESGRPDPHTHVIRPWPWSIDVDGQSRFFADRDQAIAGVRAALAAGAASIDVGCMQVNLQFHPTAFRTLQEAFDPVVNAAYAAKFLKALWAATPRREWMVAVGYYHSKTPDLAAGYRRQVQGFGGTDCRPVAPPPAPAEGTLVLRPSDPLVVAVGRLFTPPPAPPPLKMVCATPPDAGHRS